VWTEFGDALLTKKCEISRERKEIEEGWEWWYQNCEQQQWEIRYHWDWVISWAKKHMSIFKPWIVSRLKVQCFSYNLSCWQLCVFFFLIIRRCSYVRQASNTLVVNKSQNNNIKMDNHQSCNKVCVMISYAMLVHTWWSSMFYLKKTRILLFFNASLLHGLKEDDFLKNNLSNIQKIVVVTMHI
jgi:hypothetical protein